MPTPKNANYVVYKHTFPNGKVYIGITCQKVEYRWRKDGSGYKPKKDNYSPMWNAIQKYGWENVEHEILYENVTKEFASQKEKELIIFYNSTSHANGYNVSLGGIFNNMSEETKKKISEAKKGNNYGMIGENAPMYGKHHSEETKDILREKLAKNNNPMYGKHHSEETIEKLKKATSDISKGVFQIDENDNIIGEFSSISSAAKETGINKQCISFCLRGKYKKAGGYFWKYA